MAILRAFFGVVREHWITNFWMGASIASTKVYHDSVNNDLTKLQGSDWKKVNLESAVDTFIIGKTLPDNKFFL